VNATTQQLAIAALQELLFHPHFFFEVAADFHDAVLQAILLFAETSLMHGMNILR